MKITRDVHRTDDPVLESGTYICAEGETRELQKGDQFPLCPKTDEPTTWKHANHEHKTGYQVTESGCYVDMDGHYVDLDQGDVFPTCPKIGIPTTWRHAE